LRESDIVLTALAQTASAELRFWTHLYAEQPNDGILQFFGCLCWQDFSLVGSLSEHGMEEIEL
jgi:hypothetical protein